MVVNFQDQLRPFRNEDRDAVGELAGQVAGRPAAEDGVVFLEAGAVSGRRVGVAGAGRVVVLFFADAGAV